MKTFNTLIKYYQHQLNDKKRQINRLEEEKDMMQTIITSLHDSLEKEGLFYNEHPEMGFAYGQYLEQVKIKVDEAELRIQQLEDKIAPIQEEVYDLFAELKKYEIMLDNKLIKEEKELSKKESLDLDEISIITYSKGNLFDA